jgi:hypothetical protein
MGWIKQLFVWLFARWIRWFSSPPIKRKKSTPYIPYSTKNTKPDWVRYKVLVLKAYLPHEGCRKIASHFNRQYVHTSDFCFKELCVSGIKRASL